LEFRPFVLDSWENSLPLNETLASFTEKVKVWNKQVYLKRGGFWLGGIQRALSERNSVHLFGLEKNLKAEYREVLTQEEILWYHKSRVQWIQFGDCNSKFFHTSTLIRRKKEIGLEA
jgi:hypothetical protein